MSRTDLYATTLIRAYGPDEGTLKFRLPSPSGYGAAHRVAFQPSRRSQSFGYYEDNAGNKTYVNPDGTTTYVPAESSGTTKSKVSGEQVASTISSVADAISGIVGAFKKPAAPAYTPPPASTTPWGWIIGGVVGVGVLVTVAIVVTRQK